MAMVVVDDSSVQEESQLARWLGLRVGGHMALFYIRHMNRVNSRNDLCGRDDSNINIVLGIIFSLSFLTAIFQVNLG